MSYRLGIDVGGTNTDAVVLDTEDNVEAKTKHPTSEDVSTGIYEAVKEVTKEVDIDLSEIDYAMLGTTHCANAVVERRNLNKVAIIRIGKPSTLAIKPLINWPSDLKKEVGKKQYIIEGGHEYDGSQIKPLEEEKLKEIGDEIKDRVSSVAITSVFSPVNDEHEEKAKQVLEQRIDANFSLSHEVGSIGLIERENATILNAALVNAARTAAKAFRKALSAHEIDAEMYFGQNDGTLMNVDYAIKYPILTIASGPTNSIRGAASLANIKEGIIVDVGGTTTDIGALQKGFPRESAVSVEIGGVKTNFRMPDLLTLGLGGGSKVKSNNELEIGPESVGYRIKEKGKIFGGKTLTATDIAVASGQANLGEKNNLKGLEAELVEKAQQKIQETVEEGIDKMKTGPKKLPVALVGGGSILLPQELRGASETYKPENFEVANAIGVAIAQVSGEVEKVFNLDEMTRQEALKEAEKLAKKEAIEAGADPNKLEIVDKEDIPLAYLPGNATKIRVKAAGKLKTK